MGECVRHREGSYDSAGSAAVTVVVDTVPVADPWSVSPGGLSGELVWSSDATAMFPPLVEMDGKATLA